MNNKIKVGILNFHYSNHNYGAVLQACALEYVLKENGIYSEHIKYIPQGERKSLFQKIKNRIGSFLRAVGVKKNNVLNFSFDNPDVFENARDLYLTRSNKTYTSFSQLKEENFDYTHLIVGSDQVWRPSYTEGSMLVYFLDFAAKGIKKISYAASFGIDSWEYALDSKETHLAKNAIDKFDAVSVREKSGVNICHSVFGIDARHVIDPTLLAGVGFFNDITKNVEHIDGKNIVYYKLDVDETFNGLLENLKQYYSILSIENIYYFKNAKTYRYYDVPTWLSKIKHSELVVTDSFHCICFAILFNKDFIYYPNKKNRGLSRIESLFSELDISDRIYNDEVDFNSFVDIMKPLDYKHINSKLISLRENAINFLMGAIH